MKIEYFGTSLNEHGHYAWIVDGPILTKIGLYHKNWRIECEQIYKISRGDSCLGEIKTVGLLNTQETYVIITGSPYDDRPGCVSAFRMPWGDPNMIVNQNSVDYLRQNCEFFVQVENAIKKRIIQ